MSTDHRGGHNRKDIEKNFFKSWSPQMAYLLGLLFSDGTVENTQKSSRTCYFAFTSKDFDLIQQVKELLSSSHTIHTRKPLWQKIKNKEYFCNKTFYLRVGSKNMYQDLVKLGLKPRKSLTLKFPRVPDSLLSFFIRGYFDGDGCIYVNRKNNKELKVIFTCGSKKFLKRLSTILQERINTSPKSIPKSTGAYRLAFRKFDSLKILNFLYKDLYKAPFLNRKFQIYNTYLLSNLHHSISLT